MKFENIFMKGVVWTLDLINALKNIYVVFNEISHTYFLFTRMSTNLIDESSMSFTRESTFEIK